MADWPPLKNSAFTVTFPIYDADGDLVSAAASLDSEVSKNGGTFTDVTPGEAVEIATASGVYTLALAAGEMDADIVATITKTSTGGAKTAVNVMYTVVRQLIDLAYPATSGRSFVVEADGMVHGDLKEWLGTAPLALTAQRVDAIVGAMAADVVTAAAIANGAIDAATFAAGAINATAIATGAIDADALAADAIDLIWDELASGHITVGSLGQLLSGLAPITGEVNDAGPLVGDFDIDGFTEATDDHFNGHVMVFTSGALKGQSRIISDYTGAGQNCIFDRPWTNAPVDGDDFVILGPLAGGLGRLINTETDGVAHADLKEWLGVAPLALTAQRVDVTVGAMQANVLNAAAIAADAITAAKVAADVHAEAADAVWDEDIIAAHSTADSAGRNLATLDGISDRTNNSNLNSLLGIPDTAGIDMVDEIFVRDIDLFEAAAAKHSLCNAVLKAVSRIVDDAGTLKTYRTDGATLQLSQTITVNASADPIDELTSGV